MEINYSPSTSTDISRITEPITITYSSTTPQNLKRKTGTNIVPKQYHDYEDLFTKKDFDNSQNDDHGIMPSTSPLVLKPVDCKTYNLSPQEQEKLKEFIDENLRTGRIRPSSSPMASPIFLCQEERRIATPYSRLPKVKRRHNQKPLSATSH